MSIFFCGYEIEGGASLAEKVKQYYKIINFNSHGCV